MRLVLFCESSADAEMAKTLVDRVLREHGPSWVGELMESDPVHVREWSNDHARRDFFDVHALDKYLQHYKVRPLQGHFDGKKGAAGAQMARNIFSIVRAMENAARDPVRHDAVCIVWDMDAQSKERRNGLEQARTEATTWASFKIVYGCPDPEQEAWILAGFEPETDEEREGFEKLRRELRFCPVRNAQLADATSDGAKKNPKRILSELIGDHHERRLRCLSSPLDTLRQTGAQSGLCAFLDEVQQQILPFVMRSSK